MAMKMGQVHWVQSCIAIVKDVDALKMPTCVYRTALGQRNHEMVGQRNHEMVDRFVEVDMG
ncbi:hypothetical protein FRX31_032542 [Thalictrum thalictroides]|uniref:Uncharacterized protein n=1 Tax=Thalictrum thalictroides TaxID=46969 RepID=A0A7J6UZI0_THATH|nr:hypothetical protein FRX31_032542 [Thalictrum thalictroides]